MSIAMPVQLARTRSGCRRVITKALLSTAIVVGSVIGGAAPAGAEPDAYDVDAYEVVTNPFGGLGCSCSQPVPPSGSTVGDEINRGLLSSHSVRLPRASVPIQS